jgi:hypothetical protein
METSTPTDEEIAFGLATKTAAARIRGDSFDHTDNVGVTETLYELIEVMGMDRG